MTLLSLSLLVWLGSLLAGMVGALTGLGGGVVVVPLLALAFHVNLRYAAGASLLSVIATSSGAAAAYVREGWSNVRLGMLLEVATTLGALAGASTAALVPTRAVAVIFGALLLLAAAGSLRRPPTGPDVAGPPDRLAGVLRLGGTYPSPTGPVAYGVRRVPGGFALMLLAGWLSGLLGVGSGALKVTAMDDVMRVPFKVSTTTSNFMIGVTAAASAGVYLARGWVEPRLAAPVVLGVLPGALLGARLLPRMRSRTLRAVFAVAVAALGWEMILRGFTRRL
ncbi:MAG TPA: sulfite exporter TauE/SafE family protein [Anaeromyxobacter sp.]|nr:sulfite exporter TauE/SafE family protein [Anaeromyxobacter sp.]